jgi:hypothetical protein
MCLRNQIFDLLHCVLHKLGLRITFILINEKFYSIHVLTIIITCKFLAKLEVQENNFDSHMRTGVMEYSQGSHSHEEDIEGFHVSM